MHAYTALVTAFFRSGNTIIVRDQVQAEDVNAAISLLCGGMGRTTL